MNSFFTKNNFLANTVKIFAVFVIFFAFVSVVNAMTGPSVKLRGDSLIAVSINSVFLDPGAYVADADGNWVSGDVAVSGDLDIHKVGYYTLTYSGFDNEGNPATPITRTVYVYENENTAPVIELLGSNPISISVGESFVDPGAEASDKEEGDLTDKITVSGPVNTDQIGSYLIIYSVADSKGLISSISRTVNVVGVSQCSLPQTIANQVANGVVGQNFDYTIQAPEIGYSISVMQSTLPQGLTSSGARISGVPTTAGEYNVSYKSANSCGFVDSSIKISVLKDDDCTSNCNGGTTNTKPTITLIGANPATTTIGALFTDPGATANDAEDGGITNKIITSSAVNTNIAGTYKITYTVTDNGGLTASTTRTVVVQNITPSTRGTVKMCLVLANSNNVIATSSAGLPTGSFSIKLATSTNFASSTIFTKTWNASTFSPNDKNILNVNDSDCVIVGSLDPKSTYFYSQMVVLGSDWNVALYNDELVGTLTTTSEFFPYNTNYSSGTYPIANSNGTINLSLTNGERTFVIYVTKKTVTPPPPVNTPPIITLLGANPATTTIGALFTDPGATATDSEDGNLTDDIVVTGTVATTTVGAYTLTYTVTDSGGLSTSTTRSVIVSPEEIVPPVVPPVNPPGGGGGGGGSSSGGRRHPVVVGEVLGATSCMYLRDYIKIDWVNDPIEVLKVQSFLNVFEKENLSYTGVYDQSTFDAVVRFQNKYSGDILQPWGDKVTTGFVYILTKKKINEIYCNTIYPLSQVDQNEIDSFRNSGGASSVTGNTGFNTVINNKDIGTLLGNDDVSISDSISDVLNGSPIVELKDSSRSALRNAAISIFSLPQKMFDKLFQGCGYTPTLLLLILVALVIIIIKLFTNSVKGNGPKNPIAKAPVVVNPIKDSPVIILPGVMPDEEIIIENPEEGPEDVLINTPDLRSDQNENKKV